MVPLQNFSQGMLLTEDMISFHTVNSAAAVQLVSFSVIVNSLHEKLNSNC